MLLQFLCLIWAEKHGSERVNWGVKPGFHMIVMIAAIAEKSARRSQRSYGNAAGTIETIAIAGIYRAGVYREPRSSDRSDRQLSQNAFQTIQWSIFMWRHCRHVGGQKQYIFSPLGNKIYFHAKLFHCFSPPTWLPLKPSILWLSWKKFSKYDCLYNKFSKDYLNKYKILNCWTKIAEKFTRSPAEAEKKFKNIRTVYHLVLEGNLPILRARTRK